MLEKREARETVKEPSRAGGKREREKAGARDVPGRKKKGAHPHFTYLTKPYKREHGGEKKETFLEGKKTTTNNLETARELCS